MESVGVIPAVGAFQSRHRIIKQYGQTVNLEGMVQTHQRDQFQCPCSIIDRTLHYGCEDGGAIPLAGTNLMGSGAARCGRLFCTENIRRV